jgi:hypothetical protein
VRCSRSIPDLMLDVEGQPTGIGYQILLESCTNMTTSRLFVAADYDV